MSIIFVSACALFGGNVDLGSVYLVSKYDPERDPHEDLVLAIAEAEKTNKHILLEVGGDWCSWCHILDEYIQEKPEVVSALQQNYVVIKVNYSEENSNDEFLTQYPPAAGYPHFYVLDQHGNFLHSQNTADLEEGQSYNDEVFLNFLAEWGPQ